MVTGVDPVPGTQNGIPASTYVVYGFHDPSVTPTAGLPGMIFLRVAPGLLPGNPVGVWQKHSTDDADTNWSPIGSGGAGTIIVQDEGVVAVAAASILNFVGAGVVATPGAPGVATITIPGGGSVLTERYTAPGGLTAPQIGTGAPVLGDGVILPFLADHDSVIANLQGSGLLFEGVGFDYTLDDAINPGFTTIIFDAALVPFLVVGQNFQVQYLRA